MFRGTRFWTSGFIISLVVAVAVGGTSFVLMTIGTHRFLSATTGKILSDAQQVRILDESMLAPVPLTTVGLLIGAVAAVCVPVFFIGWLIQFRSRRPDGD